MQLLECVKIFSSKIKALVDTVGEENLKTYTGFFFDTFFHHYKLYQCVFTTERERMQINMDLAVNIPPIPCPFEDGKDIAVWEYQEKIDAIEEREMASKTERESLLRKMQDEHKAMLEENQAKIENTHMPLERQVKSKFALKYTIQLKVIRLLVWLVISIYLCVYFVFFIYLSIHLFFK